MSLLGFYSPLYQRLQLSHRQLHFSQRSSQRVINQSPLSYPLQLQFTDRPFYSTRSLRGRSSMRVRSVRPIKTEDEQIIFHGAYALPLSQQVPFREWEIISIRRR